MDIARGRTAASKICTDTPARCKATAHVKPHTPPPTIATWKGFSIRSPLAMVNHEDKARWWRRADNATQTGCTTTAGESWAISTSRPAELHRLRTKSPRKERSGQSVGHAPPEDDSKIGQASFYGENVVQTVSEIPARGAGQSFLPSPGSASDFADSFLLRASAIPAASHMPNRHDGPSALPSKWQCVRSAEHT